MVTVSSSALCRAPHKADFEAVFMTAKSVVWLLRKRAAQDATLASVFPKSEFTLST